MKNLVIIDHPLVKCNLIVLLNKKELSHSILVLLIANSTIAITSFRDLRAQVIPCSGRSK